MHAWVRVLANSSKAGLKPLRDQIQFGFRRGDAALGFLLEGVQDIYDTCQPNRVHRAAGLAIKLVLILPLCFSARLEIRFFRIEPCKLFPNQGNLVRQRGVSPSGPALARTG